MTKTKSMEFAKKSPIIDKYTYCFVCPPFQD